MKAAAQFTALDVCCLHATLNACGHEAVCRPVCSQMYGDSPRAHGMDQYCLLRSYQAGTWLFSMVYAATFDPGLGYVRIYPSNVITTFCKADPGSIQPASCLVTRVRACESASSATANFHQIHMLFFLVLCQHDEELAATLPVA